MTDDWGSKHNGCRVGLGYSDTLEYSADRSQARIHDFDLKFSSDDPIFDTSNSLSCDGGAITNGGAWANEVYKSSSWSGTMTMRTQSGEWQDLTYGSSHTATANVTLSGISYAGATLTSGHTFTYPARAYSLPTAGATPVISSATASSTTIYWNFPSATASTGATPVDSAMLQCSVDGVNWWNVVSLSQGLGANTWYTHSGLTPNSQYYYRTQGYNSSGYGAVSGTSAGVWVAPQAPTLTGQGQWSDGGIYLYWTDNASGRGSDTALEIVSYNTQTGGYAVVYTFGAGTSSGYTYYGPANSFFQLYARSRNAAGYSADSAWTSVYMTSMSPPSSVSVSAGTVTTPHSTTKDTVKQSSNVTLYWGASPYGQSYEVYVNGGYYGLSGTTSMNITGLNAATQYSFYVIGRRTDGYGNRWSVASSTVYQTMPDILGPPLTVTLGAFTRLAGRASATLSWAAVAGATGYYVTVVNGSGIPNTNFVSGTSVLITNMVAGELTRFSVSTQNAVGYSLSSTLSQDGIYSPIAPPAPATVTLGAFTSAAGKSSATLSWTASTDTETYTIAVANGTGIPSLTSTAGTSVTISDIDPGELTRFSVKSVNDTGTSPVTLSQAGIYAPTVPDSPTTVAVSYNATTSVITISWLAPANNGGTPLTNYQYQIETQATAGTDPWVVSTAYTNAGLVTSVTFAKAWAFNFRVSVRAVNAIGNSTAGLDETGVIGGYAKVWNGTVWVNQFFYVYTADWAKPALVRKFDGAAWVPLT